MKGSLTGQPVVELIREVWVKGFTGTLRLERERVQVAIYFDKGEIIFAASNVKSLRLKEYLIKRGVVTEKDVATLPANTSDVALGAALSEAGKIKEKDLSALLTTLVIDILRLALLWTEGVWEFNERARLVENVRVSIDVPGLLAAAAQRLPDDIVSERWKNSTENISRGNTISKTSNFLPAESFVLSRLDKPAKLSDLINNSGLSEIEALRTIYGLALRGLIQREYWQQAFRAGAIRTKEEPVVAAAGDGAKSSDAWNAAATETEDLEIFLARQKNASSHYEILEVESNASTSQIKQAYYALARRYHPDRFHLKSGTRQHNELVMVFAKITQAYENLMNPAIRQEYDRSLAQLQRVQETRQRETKSSDPVINEEELAEASRAELSFKQGAHALEQGLVDVAIRSLAAAVRIDPQTATYHAYYGKALGMNESSRRLAENEIQTAIKMEPNNNLFRVMLGELYWELKFYNRAQSEIERVLATDPRNVAANALLQKLEKSRKVG